MWPFNKKSGVPKNDNPPAPPAEVKLASAEWRNCEIRGRKTIKATLTDGTDQEFIKTEKSWATYPMMRVVNAETHHRLNNIEAYLKQWGGPYPTAHETHFLPNGTPILSHKEAVMNLQKAGETAAKVLKSQSL